MAMATLAGNARTWAHGATRRNARAIGRGLGFAAVGGLTALLLSNVLPYFGAGADDMPFLHEHRGVGRDGVDEVAGLADAPLVLGAAREIEDAQPRE